MKTRTKALIGVGVAAVIGSVAIAGASFAERGFGGHHGLGGHHGMGFMAKGQFGLMSNGNIRLH